MDALVVGAMTPDQFEALAQLLRLRTGSAGRELAQMVLVEGLSNAEAAARLGATRQATHNAVRRVRAGMALIERYNAALPTKRERRTDSRHPW